MEHWVSINVMALKRTEKNTNYGPNLPHSASQGREREKTLAS